LGFWDGRFKDKWIAREFEFGLYFLKRVERWGMGRERGEGKDCS
jgi:hypothetical protein